MTDMNVDIDSLLDGTLDDLADVPDFAPYPAGSHNVSINWDLTKLKEKKTIGLKMIAKETVELNNANDKPLAEGAVAFVSFKMDNEYGQSAFRKIMSALAAHYGAATNRELMDKSDGAECLVITSLRKNKDKTAEFTQIVELGVI